MTETSASPNVVGFWTTHFFTQLQERLDAEESLSKLTRGMNLSLLLDCAGDEFLISVEEGRLSVKQASGSEKAEFGLSAPYEVWERISKGQAKVQGEIVSGRVRFRGSMPRMLLYLNKLVDLESSILRIMKAMSIEFRNPIRASEQVRENANPVIV